MPVIASGSGMLKWSTTRMDGFEDLCERIRAHCASHGWYGPDNARLLGQATRRAERGFLFPPATGDQVRATEEALGFALPTALRAVYLGLANGGFGPGYGLVGASCGAPSDDVPYAGGLDYWFEPQRPPVSTEDAQGDDVAASPDDSALLSRHSNDQRRRAQDPALAATLTRADWRLSE
jgi:hypothetical protein